jgi:ATP-dependent helicase/nuclease subunit B
MLPSVYAIPFDQPFLDTLVAGLMDRAGGDPLALTRMTVLLPTRRAARSLREAFLRAGNGRPLLLPRMIPVGDLDPEELALFADEGEPGVSFDLPPPVSPLRRRLLLTQLVHRFGQRDGMAMSLGQAAPLVAELARFLDEVEAEGCDFARLQTLVPEEYAEHWQKILQFLTIVTAHWPAMLDGIGCLDPGERRNQLLAAQAAMWRRDPPRGPVIAAGITGGIPAVAELMAVVAQLPQGAIVLPGFDFDLDGASWEEILLDPAHPQHLSARFLARLELDAQAVRPWSARAIESGRAHLLRESLAPGTLTHRWRFIAGLDAGALEGLSRIDCPGPQEEGLAIALLLRERLERPGETAALVTPDRALGRRVAAELKRWNIDIDDSAGVPLNKTPPGVFLRLLLDAADEEMAPLPLLALLKHPLAACGMAPAEFRERVRRLEIEALRGPRPKPGFAGLRAVLREGAISLHKLVDRIEAALAPLIAALAAPEIGLDALVAAHIAAAEALAARDDGLGASFLWREPAGEAAALFLNELLQEAADFPLLRGREYAALFEALLAGPVVRPPYGRHPRLFIWGLLEARLQHADLVILGGLNEGVWPPATESDPWLSRPMRRAFGLPPPERRVGAAALDFLLGLGARAVVMTRATRVEGTPTVPSRWLLRLETVLSAVGLEGKMTDRSDALDWQRLIDEPTAAVPIAPPAPTPPVAARPRKLSVTEIEIWRRDPYAIYAKHILRLRALDPIDADPNLADRGLIIHAALAQFLRAYPHRLPADAAAQLVAFGREAFGEALVRPGVWAFWWPRFLRIADWIIAEERQRRAHLDDIFAEVSGELVLPAPAGPFTLTARADRIERHRDGSLALIDYKTGTPPRGVELVQGFAPQLPLEAAIAARGGFAGIAPARVEELAFWRLTGGDPPGEVRIPESDPARLEALIDSAVAGLGQLVAAFDDPAMPYRAVPDPSKAPRYSDYAHLERVKEWFSADEALE